MSNYKLIDRPLCRPGSSEFRPADRALRHFDDHHIRHAEIDSLDSSVAFDVEAEVVDEGFSVCPNVVLLKRRVDLRIIYEPSQHSSYLTSKISGTNWHHVNCCWWRRQLPHFINMPLGRQKCFERFFKSRYFKVTSLANGLVEKFMH